MNCAAATRSLPGYREGMLAPAESALVFRHLNHCAPCREMLERCDLLASDMASMGRAVPPRDLPTRIRRAAAALRGQPSVGQRVAARCWLFFHNILQPIAVPATGGLFSAVLTFMLVTQGLIVGQHFGMVKNDLPLNFIQPAQLESLAPFPVADYALDQGSGVSMVIVEADVDALGEVTGYQILSGPDTPELHSQVDQVLMFSSFKPQMSFGRPTSGGRVLLSFSEVRVKG
jgi:hypothetical protein